MSDDTPAVPRRRPLVEQLKASPCPLCQLAAEAIEQMRKDHADEMREMARDMRDACSEARAEGRADASDHGW